MKKKITLSFIIVSFVFSISAMAQLRGDISTPFDFQGPVIKQGSATAGSVLNRFFNSITMSHSYSMSMGSVGGSYQSLNAYTNTIQMNLTDNLDARVDVSFLHSPFGGSNNMYGFNQNQPRIILNNAELNYKFSENSHIQLRFQQTPASFGYGFGPHRYGRYNSFNPWY